VSVPPLVVRRIVIDPLFVPVALTGVVIAVAVAALGVLTLPLDRRARLSRASLLVGTYLVAEAGVLVCAFVLWLCWPVVRGRWEPAHLWLARRTLDGLMATARSLVGLRMTIVEPPPGTVDAQALPVMVLSRHAGPGDSFVLLHLLLSRYRRVPRVVLLARLQLDPAIDLLLGRLGACFLRNDGTGERAVARVADLARTLSGPDALVIFPEGGNFTPLRRRRLITRMRARGQSERAAIAEDLEFVLPPRPAGVLGALDAGRFGGAAIVAHSGLDQLLAPGQIWRAIPFASPLVLRWWWVPAAEIPSSGADRLDWLTLHWAVVNAWVDTQRTASARSDGSGR
jgi:1-acyl-sn-glycerol-3-phosphate acyltransferase